MFSTVLDNLCLRIISPDDTVSHLDILPIRMEDFLIYHIPFNRDICLLKKPVNPFTKYRPGVHIGQNHCLPAWKTLLENIRSAFGNTLSHFEHLCICRYRKGFSNSFL